MYDRPTDEMMIELMKKISGFDYVEILPGMFPSDPTIYKGYNEDYIDVKIPERNAVILKKSAEFIRNDPRDDVSEAMNLLHELISTRECGYHWTPEGWSLDNHFIPTSGEEYCYGVTNLAIELLLEENV